MCIAVSGVLALALIKMIPNKAERAKESNDETARANQLARAVMAQEKSAYQLARIADQLEKNGK